MQGCDIKKCIDYVENFDSKNIKVRFLFVNTSSGTLLMNSLINGHPQVLTMPVGMSTYSYLNHFFDENRQAKPDLKKCIEDFADSNFFTMGNLWGNMIPEENQTMEFRNKFIESLYEILSNLKEINNKNIFLAVTFAYANVKNLDISNIKCIFQHHHIMPFEFDFHNKCLKQGCILNLIEKDFPDYKVLMGIRDWTDAFISGIDANRKRANTLWDMTIPHILGVFELLLFSSYSLVIWKGLYKENLIFYKFEDIHLKTEETMHDIAKFLDVDYDKSLLESSFEGRLWYWNGFDLKKSQHGTNPNYKVNSWKTKLNDYQTKLLFVKLLNPLNKFFGYPEYHGVKNKGRLKKLLNFEKEFLIKMFKIRMKNHESIFNFIFKEIPKYKKDRKQILRVAESLAQILDKCENADEFTNYILNKPL